MVFTHALILAKEDVQKIQSLGDVFSLFVSEIPEDKGIRTPIDLNLTTMLIDEGAEVYPAYLQKTVSALIEGGTPIIFAGDLDAFENTIIHLWYGAIGEFRSELKFRISITPDDIKKDNDLTIVYIQDELVSRWQNHKLVHSTENKPVTINSHSQRLLLGLTKNNPFVQFIDDLNVDLSDFARLGVCDKAYSLYLELDNVSPDLIRQLVRLIEKLSPGVNDGGKIKSAVLHRLKGVILSGEHSNLKSLRNITLKGFKKGELTIGAAMSKYVDSVFKKPIDIFLDTVSEWINLTADNNGKVNWWQEAMESTLRATLALNNMVVVENVWKIINNEAASLDKIFNFIPKNRDQEVVLRKYFPKDLNKSSAKALGVIAKKRKWFLLHMDCLLNHLDRVEAAKQQLIAEQNVVFGESVGTLELCEGLSKEELLQLTLSEKNNKLIQIVGGKAASTKWYLSKIDLSEPVWLEMWAVSLHNTKQLEFGIKDLDKKAKGIYNLLRESKTVPTIILELLSKSYLSDLSSYNERRDIWEKLPNSLRESFLESTAEGFIEKIINAKSVDETVETELKSRIISDDFMTVILNKYKGDISAVIKIYASFQDLKDQFLADYIHHYSLSIPGLESAQLGDLVKSRNYYKSAHQIFEKAKYNDSFRIALNKCKSLIHLGIFDKLIWENLFGTIIDENAAYNALTELSIKLFPQGPEENDLWKRARGDVSKLTNHHTREENWRRAVHLLRYGGGGEITTVALLKTMKEDFANNGELNAIFNYFKKQE